MTPFVTLEQVTHAYGRSGVPAVDGLSLMVNRGEFAAIVGPSGCGKSTVMKLATGLQFPQGGTVTVAGEPVRRAVRIAGMAFQNPTLLPWRTTLDNLLLPLEIVEPHRSRIGRHRAEYVARAEALLAQVGLAGQGKKYPWELSGGMQQRASLCRALIHEPELLMLDEPFGALDAFTREELWCVIRDLHAARPVTVILVTHDLREAAFLSDRIFCMSNRPGRIIAEREVTFPRPRDLEITYTPAFTELVHDLRARIAEARATA
ncbi:MAG: ABC transporter ATP-binding protein [Alsobacter sp.]